ncbi:MAG TPA: radical SAM protein [Candidatus Tectomicrobia bacterium]|nr:radical SAM protein [Candidatus Tectomicrobia bacterium]
MAPPPPRYLQLEVTAACNLRCRMCLVRYRPAADRRTSSLPFAAFRKLIDDLPGLERLTLQGLGEPLLAPDLVPMVEYAAARGIRVGFNTNATLLTRRLAERLVDAGLDWLVVSLDGATAATYEGIRDGARLARVDANVRGLVEVMRERGASRPALSVAFVAMRRNIGELADVVRLAADWGVRSVRVQNLSHSFEDMPADGAYAAIRQFTAAEALWGEGDPIAEAPFAAARRVAEELDVTLRLPAVEPVTSRPPGTPGCDWPWTGAYVRHDGRVQPCCMLMGEDRGILGDLGQATFGEIWSGEAYERFRAALEGTSPPAVCRGCSMYRGVF